MISAFAGSKALRDAGILSPSDLIKFPWDDEREASPMTEDDKERMKEEMRICQELIRNGKSQHHT
jgi:hypothetical protein